MDQRAFPAQSGMQHPTFGRRAALQAGAVGLLGLGMNHVSALRSEAAAARTADTRIATAKNVIYVYLSGGLSQHESFDPKPEAPAQIRGEFNPIATATPGLFISEHLPLLAQRSHLWSLCRSMTHPHNEHSSGDLAMLSGRTQMPPNFKLDKAQPTDWPGIPAIVGSLLKPQNNLPPAAILPEKLIHNSGRLITGQIAGIMGAEHDPWFIEASNFNSKTYGAYPKYEFHFAAGGAVHNPDVRFQAPSLSLPEGLGMSRLSRRLDLLKQVEDQREDLEAAAMVESFDRHRQGAINLLTKKQVKEAFDVVNAPAAELDRYGRNSFGWSMLMARRLIEAGVSMVQVNLGNAETWDTHGFMFPLLKDFLFPPFDQSMSALLDDLHDRGLLDDTLIVMAGEFGRTPRIFTLPQFYTQPGRGHWGAVQSVFFAGGGVKGGRVIGASDKIGGNPIADLQTPENLAATIYSSLGLPKSLEWHDQSGRPHQLYNGEPMAGLFA